MILRPLLTIATALPTAGIASASDGVDTRAGEALFVERCADCHMYPTKVMPSSDAMSALPAAVVLESMRSGTMKRYASGLTPPQLREIATWLTGTDPGPSQTAPAPRNDAPSAAKR